MAKLIPLALKDASALSIHNFSDSRFNSNKFGVKPPKTGPPFKL